MFLRLRAGAALPEDLGDSQQPQQVAHKCPALQLLEDPVPLASGHLYII